MSSLERFFEAIDRAWVQADHPPTTLSIIGSTALMFPTNYSRTTKDSDVIETSDLSEPTQHALLKIGVHVLMLHQQPEIVGALCAQLVVIGKPVPVHDVDQGKVIQTVGPAHHFVGFGQFHGIGIPAVSQFRSVVSRRG